MMADATVFLMEATLSFSQPTSLDILQRFGDTLSAITNVWKNIAERAARKQKIRQSVDQMLDETGKICSVLPLFQTLVQAEKHSPISFQAQANTLWVIRDIYAILSITRRWFEDSPILRKNQFAELKKQSKILLAYQKELDILLAQKVDFSLENAVPKPRIGSKNIQTPLRILLEDDDTGVHVSCFELPQVYGFGETEEEALAMLDREIISLNEDLHDGSELSTEFELVRDLLGMVLGNEKY